MNRSYLIYKEEEDAFSISLSVVDLSRFVVVLIVNNDDTCLSRWATARDSYARCRSKKELCGHLDLVTANKSS